MGVLVQGLCAVVRCRSLEASWPGRTEAFLAHCRNLEDVIYAISDGVIAAVSVRGGRGGPGIEDQLRQHGIGCEVSEDRDEVVLLDMYTGPLMPCDWIAMRRHKHGFMHAWDSGSIPGSMVVPDEWDPSDAWSMTREDLRDDPNRAFALGHDDGVDTFLDLESGRVLRGLDTRSPVIVVEDESTIIDLSAFRGGSSGAIAGACTMLRAIGGAFLVDYELQQLAIVVGSAIEIRTGADWTGPRVVPIRIGMCETADPQFLYYEAVLPLYVPESAKDRMELILERFNDADSAWRIDFDYITGTCSVMEDTARCRASGIACSTERMTSTLAEMSAEICSATTHYLNDQSAHINMTMLHIHTAGNRCFRARNRAVT